MRLKRIKQTCVLTVWMLAIASVGLSQGTKADYERAFGLRSKYQELAANIVERVNWIGKTNRFWYRRTVRGGAEFLVFDAETLGRKPAFDHEKLAAALSAATGGKVAPLKLPFQTFTFSESEKAIEFAAAEVRWSCDLAEYKCSRLGAVVQRGDGLAGPRYDQPSEPKISPDGRLEAVIYNYNIRIRGRDRKTVRDLSWDGSEGDYYALASIVWSPDSKMIAAYRVKPGYRRKVNYVESSPAEQLQPAFSTKDYAKPGDVLDLPRPVLFQIETGRQMTIDDTLFANPYSLTRIEWRKDSRAFTFEYNQRGHEVYRVIEVEAATGKPRAAISEEPKTFFCYSSKKYRYDIADGREVIWMSERDGWNHLYLIDGATGAVKNRITKGDWVVRGVEKVDEEKRQIWFQASGMEPGKDPYFVHYFRINFDGSGLIALTSADANHAVSFSADMKYYVDTWSRVDLAPVSELRLAADGKLLGEVERGNIDELIKAGWRAPEVFVSTGRDGRTDIWGLIYRPTNFDPLRKYPVIENIYAGPHSSHVPKSFAAHNQMQSMAELGFIVVQIDGMGTSNRSKAFHDVAWKNLGDAGFPDRILWHRAAAAKYPYYDISRVGIYGTSAGGQSSMGGLLFHPDFYQACVSSCGCHDSRMDKIWWNEQWMGWPIGPQYSASSNVDNAHRLRGKLMLILGEMDANVDPSSTMQVVNALIKAGKTFDLLVIPGAGHTSGGPYGDKRRYDFFVRHLLGVEPPDWNEDSN